MTLVEYLCPFELGLLMNVTFLFFNCDAFMTMFGYLHIFMQCKFNQRWSDGKKKDMSHSWVILFLW